MQITKSLCAILLCATLHAADKYICDAPQNGHECDYRNSELQKALSDAACGDTFYLQAGFTYYGHFSIPGETCGADAPITVTSSRVDWLPGPYSRITPSYLPNLPLLADIGANEPVLYGEYDSMRNPPNNWRLIGVAFSAGRAREVQGTLIATIGAGYPNNKTDFAHNASELPDGIVFDRVLVFGPPDSSVNIQTGIRFDTRSSVIKNSFLQDLFAAGYEGHGIALRTSVGPITLTNNYISSAGISVFSGGSEPDFLGAMPANLVMRYNYTFKAWKWWPNVNSHGSPSANPYPNDFTSNASKRGCTKNQLEFKALDTGLIEGNVFENSWNENACEGQRFGVTLTPRTVRRNSTDSYWPGNRLGGLTTRGTSFSWSGTFGDDAAADIAHKLVPGQGVCYGVYPHGAWDCRTIVSVDNSKKTGTLDAPLATDVTNVQWSWVSDPYPMLHNITLRNSVFKNTFIPFSHLGRDVSSLTSATDDHGRISGLTIVNNLVDNTVPFNDGIEWRFVANENLPFGSDPDVSAKDYVFEHNTIFMSYKPYNALAFSAENKAGAVKPIAKIQNFSIRSNIFQAGVYNVPNSSGIGINDLGGVVNAYTSSADVDGNLIPGMSCNQEFCSNNVANGTAAFVAGTYKIKPGTALAKAAHDGSDIGVNYDELPLIRDLKVIPSRRTAVVDFYLSKSIADAANTQPCVLEVSDNENLRSGLGPYTVINDLNPAFFKQPDATSRSNPLLPPIRIEGDHVQWPIGKAASVTGDDGVEHDLQLSPGTEYWGRLMCYGDTQRFTFTTLPAAVDIRPHR